MLNYLLILIIPALFINLGLMPFILDEATRAIVSLEMIYSGNYITPTINGEFYYNKPPLFNWIQILFVKITGSTSEFTFRLPVVISLMFFAFTIYQTQKKEGGRKTAFYSALAFLTCGRILFYDSFRGLIDISFSWVIYLMFWSIYDFGRKREFLNLFIISYLLAAMGFMMKGLPALVFLGISLMVYFIYTKEFRKLFSFSHLAGFGIFLFIVGSYILAYQQYNSLSVYLETLWSESSKRTFIDNTLWSSIKHLFLFPLDFIYHFLPWTLLIPVFFLKDSMKKIRKNDFAIFSALMFISNIVIYWVSPAIYPRYLFMFLPLIFYTIFLVYTNSEENIIIRRIISVLVKSMIVVVTFLIICIPFIANEELYDLFYLKYILILALSVQVFYFLKIRVKEQILVLVAILLVARIAFNIFVLPDRIAEGSERYQKNGALVTGELTRSRPLYLYKDTRIHHTSTFYIMKTREEILERWYQDPLASHFYIVEGKYLEELPPHKVIHSFETRIEALRLYLVLIRVCP